MGINPNIILGINQPQFTQPDPIERYGKIMGLQHLMQQQDLGGVQLANAQQAQDADQRVRALFGKNPNATPEDVMAIDPKRGLDMRKSALDAKKTESEIAAHNATVAKEKRELDLDHAKRGASLLKDVKDPTSYMVAVTEGQRQGIFPAQMPAYDPQVVDRMRSAGLTMAENLEAEHRRETAAETARANAAREAENVLHNRTTEKTAQGQLGVAQGHLAVAKQQTAQAKLSQPFEATIEGRPVLVQQDKQTGALLDVNTKKPVLGVGPKASDSEQVASGYAQRMAAAENIMSGNLGGQTPGVLESGAQHIPLVGKVLSNAARGDERQQYRQAQEDWVRAKLRKESGAVIADEEMDREIRTYFPQLNDGKPLIAQKADARRIAIDAMERAAGPARQKAPAGGGASSGPAVKIKGDDGYNALPAGAHYIGPDNVERIK